MFCSSRFLNTFQGGRPNDWTCTSCNNSNYHWRETCNRCQGPRPDGHGSPDAPGGREGGAITSLTSSSSGRGGGFGGVRGGGAPGGGSMRGRGGGSGGSGSGSSSGGARGVGPLRGGSGHRGSRPQPY